MAKTQFQNETIVSVDFLNAIFHTSDGHVHDGGADDGHAEKVSLASHVKDSLPIGGVNGLSAALTALENAVASIQSTYEISGRSSEVQLVAEYMTELQYIGWTLAPGRRVIFKSARYDISESSDVRLEIIIDGPVVKFTSPANTGSVGGLTTEIFRNETENPTDHYFLIWAKNTSETTTRHVKEGGGWSLTFEECGIPA